MTTEGPFGMVFGSIYDANTPAGCRACLGTGCFRGAFVATTFALGLGVFLGSWLALLRTNGAHGKPRVGA